MVGNGMGDGLERGIWLRITDDVGGVCAGGAGLGVYRAGVEGAVVVGKREDVLFLKVL